MFWNKKKKTEDEDELIEWRTYQDKTYEELEKEVDAAYSVAYRLQMIRNIVITVILIFLFHDVLFFYARFALPHKPFEVLAPKDSYVSIQEPEIEMIDLEDRGFMKYSTLESKEDAELFKVARCVVSAKQVARSFLFVSTYFPWHKDQKAMERVAMYDMGVVWGDLADPENLNDLYFICGKDIKNRVLYPRLKLGKKHPPIAWTQMNEKMAHIQVIPANGNIMHALIYSGKNKPVKLEGYIVNVYVNGRCIAANNFNNLYAGRDARNGGDRRIMLVDKIQVGNKVYK